MVIVLKYNLMYSSLSEIFLNISIDEVCMYIIILLYVIMLFVMMFNLIFFLRYVIL